MKILAALLLAAAAPLYSHVGSPDVFYEGSAGPYRLLVTVRPPQVIPGVAEVEIRSVGTGVEKVRVAPLRLLASNQFSPVPDEMQRSKDDPQFFSGTVWLMSTGSWKVLIQAEGKPGKGEIAVPVPALSTRVMGMQTSLAVILIPLCLVLVLGLASIASASAREAELEPGQVPDARRIRRSRIVMAVVLVGTCVVLAFGNWWWSAEAGDYSRIVYKPLRLKAAVNGGNLLALTLDDPGWLNRRVDDLLPDHGHLMHLFIVNLPRMDQVWHLHPERGQEPETFTQTLPTMSAGSYALYADVVHANGIAETATARIDLPAIGGVKREGPKLQGDDAASGPPIIPKGGYNPDVAELPGGYRMLWERSALHIRARQPYQFRFRLVDAQGADAKDVELYMGMQGHAAFIKDDGSVFAHVHPSGSVPAATMALATPDDPHAMHTMAHAGLPAQVTFPYGLPQPGIYRIFVQIKRGGEIMTGMFNASVEN
jgi:hypothetical protein